MAGTTDDLLYESRRQGPWFSFTRRVPDDTYAVTLYFADPAPPTPGDTTPQTFSMSRPKEKRLLDHFNIVSDVGVQSAVKKTFIVPVTDGRLELDFRADRGDAKVSAVSVVRSAFRWKRRRCT